MRYGIKLTKELLANTDKGMAGKMVEKYFNRFLEKVGREENIYINFFTESDSAEEEEKKK